MFRPNENCLHLKADYLPSEVPQTDARYLRTYLPRRSGNL